MGEENKPYMQAMQELRRSSAASRHVPKKRKGTRTARKREAIREQLRNSSRERDDG